MIPMRLLIFLYTLLMLPRLHAQESGYEQSRQAHRSQQYDSALFFIQKAIPFFKQRQLQDSLVLAYIQKANVVWAQSGTQQGLKVMDTALTLARKLPPNNIALVSAFSKKGEMHMLNAEVSKAKKYFQQALANIPANASPNDEYSKLYSNIAWLHLDLQAFDTAMQYAEKAKTIVETLHGKDARQLLTVYQTLMLIAQDGNAYNRAEEYGKELVRLSNLHLSPNDPNKGLMHNDLGSLYEIMHRYDEALYHRQQALKIIQADYAKHKNPQLLAIAFNNMGNLYQTMGELQLSEQYFEKSNALHEINYGPKGAGFVRPLVHLAGIKNDLEKYDEAAQLYARAYNLQKEVDAQDWRNMAYVETQYGDLFFSKKQYNKAEAYYLKAIANLGKAGISNTTIVQQTHNTLAQTYAHTGRTAEALALLQNVLSHNKKTYPKGNIVIAGQYNRISETWLLSHQPAKALLYSDSTFLELLQKPVLPAGNWIKDLPYYHQILRYLQNRTAIERALYNKDGNMRHLERITDLAQQYGTFLEKSLPALRTQNSMRQLAEQHKKIYNAAIEACWDLEKKHHAKNYLEAAFDFTERSKGLLLRLAANNIMIDASNTHRSAAEKQDLFWRKRISALNAQYLDDGKKSDSLLTLLTASLESYYRFQDSMLQSNQSEQIKSKYRLRPASIDHIKNQLLGKGQSLVEYAVTSDYVFIFVITHSEFSVHRLPVAVLSEISKLRKLFNLSAEQFSTAAYNLYQALIQPAEHLFLSEKLIVIPDGELFYLNFELLISDNKQQDFSKMKYLIHNYEITYQLSATYATMHRKQAPANEKAMLMAPVFTDEMKQAYQQSMGDSATADPYYFSLLRQPFSMRAAQQIGKYISNDLFAEQDAVESVFRQRANDYYILHLGTHAEVNNMAPLQSRFFLAKQLTPDSVANDDGYLHAYEIYAMQLQAELAVLTACETGTGSISRGEGVLSLAHSFMYAGCPSVIMSLWQIDEKASADIIATFYKYLSQGKSRGEALRLAKLSHLKKSAAASAHPYFWAGMALVGDDKPMALTSSATLWGWSLAIVALLGVGLFRMYKKRKWVIKS